MITTITLNPAVDKTCTLAKLMPGQVNRMNDVRNIAGGKGVNVTKILRQYGYPVRALGFIGGYTGQFIEDCLKEMGVECRFTHVSGETRCNTNVLSEDGVVTELLESGPIITKEELAAFVAEYEAVLEVSDVIVISGSVPEGVPSTIYADLIRRAYGKGKRVCLDTSGDCLKEGVLAHPFMIKPNLKEMEALLDTKIESIPKVAEASRNLVKKGIFGVLVSMGEKGLLYVTEREALYAKAPDVPVINTVACGDSVVASFVMSLMKGESQEECLKRAVAISAANATTFESAVIPKETAEQLYGCVKIEKIKTIH